MADERKYFRWAVIGTIAWVVIFLIYFAIKPKLFTRMFPHELGEFLEGFSAPLAFLWALLAVLFQRRQFMNETDKLKRESEDSKEKTGNVKLDHLLDQLGMEIQTLAQACEKCELHKKDADPDLLSDVVISYQVCTNLARSKNYSLLLSKAGAGLRDFVEKIDSGWVIDVDEDELEYLAAYIDALKLPIANINAAIANGSKCDDLPTQTDVDKFTAAIDNASQCINAIQREYNELGTS